MRLYAPSAAALLASVALAQQAPDKPTPRPPQVQPDVKVLATTPIKEPTTRIPRPAPNPVDSLPRALQPLADEPFVLFPDRTVVLFDAPGDGALWSRTATYKARFDGRSATFIPFFGPNAPQNYPIELRLDSITVDGEKLALDAATAVRDERTVTFDRGSVVEYYALTGESMEQLFRFDALPQLGQIVIRIAAETDLLVEATVAGGLRFSNAIGSVGYSRAVAFDAGGRRTKLSTRLVDGAVEIRVPEDFVREARLPLVVDPVLSVYASFTNPANLALPDCSYDATADEYVVTWQDDYSATDHDVFVQRYDPSLNPIGGQITIDFTSDCWEEPKIANNPIADQYLVVATESTSCSSPYWISGRTLDAGSTTTGSQFAIADASLPGHRSGDKRHPDVGGDANTVGPTFYTVVWEREYSPTDHDIHMKQVTTSGTLRSALATLIDNSLDDELNPSISKSCGKGPTFRQVHTIAYERAFSATDHDIRAAMTTWDGSIAVANFSVNYSILDQRNASPSSPTDDRNDGNRYVLIAYGDVSFADTDIWGTVYDHTGRERLRSNLTSIGLDGFDASQPQYRASVDTDGCKFVVGYGYARNSANTDTWIGTLSYNHGANTLTVLEDSPIGWGRANETDIEVACEQSSGARSSRAIATWRNDRGSLDNAIGSRIWGTYGSVPGSHAVRANGCASLPITVTGDPVLGLGTITYSTPGPSSILFGTPAAVPLYPLCRCLRAELGVTPFITVGSPMTLTLICDPALAGVTFSAQGALPMPGGLCLNLVEFSDTVDTTLGL